MTSAANTEKLLTKVLNNAAKKLNLNNYALNLNTDALRGDGFLGEFYKVSITDLDTDTVIPLAMKKAPTDKIRREESNIDLVYQNEIAFYSKIYPALRKFQEENVVNKPFNNIPKFIVANSEIGDEVIVLEDITIKGFLLREKSLLLDDEHARLTFQTYGRFHALSFCFKEQKPREFAELVGCLHNLWKQIAQAPGFRTVLPQIIEKTFKSLNQSSDGPVKEKFQKYVNHALKIYQESINYKGQFFVLLHGDCWSNNMMYKYQDLNNYSKLEDIKLIDFQLMALGTPVNDLSYFFYTGGSKELFDNLENYLDIYHDSFTKTAKALGCDDNKLFPREQLSQDWRQYAKVGMMLAFILTKIKLISKEDSIEMIESMDRKTEENAHKRDEIINAAVDEELFKKRVRDIVVHMYEINAL